MSYLRVQRPPVCKCLVPRVSLPPSPWTRKLQRLGGRETLGTRLHTRYYMLDCVTLRCIIKPARICRPKLPPCALSFSLFFFPPTVDWFSPGWTWRRGPSLIHVVFFLSDHNWGDDSFARSFQLASSLYLSRRRVHATRGFIVSLLGIRLTNNLYLYHCKVCHIWMGPTWPGKIILIDICMKMFP